jgi:hypothetical protein
MLTNGVKSCDELHCGKILFRVGPYQPGESTANVNLRYESDLERKGSNLYHLAKGIGQIFAFGKEKSLIEMFPSFIFQELCPLSI